MHLEQRILVTGGSGFLGSHLCGRLLAEGAEIICLDNFFTGARRNVEHLLASSLSATT
jgi:UDP-glucuronate decarboxylase